MRSLWLPFWWRPDQAIANWVLLMWHALYVNRGPAWSSHRSGEANSLPSESGAGYQQSLDRRDWRNSPPPAIDTSVPLRIQVTPSPGWRLVGRDWLDHPLLHWETSEIECLCALWKPPSASQPAPPSQSRARIEVWREDIARLWGSSGISGSSLPPVESSEPASQPTQEERPFPNDTALNERVTAYLIVEPCTSECSEDYALLRQALWPEETMEEHRRHAASMLSRPKDAVVYVAREENGRVIAFAEATIRRDYVNGCITSPVAFLEGLFVEIPSRRRGIARLLCKSIEDWAAGLGCTEFASDVLLDNETGLSVHEALGFEESERVVFYLKRLPRK